ncbi:MAG: YopX family protein, partial [Ruminiclostridium sp.]
QKEKSNLIVTPALMLKQLKGACIVAILTEQRKTKTIGAITIRSVKKMREILFRGKRADNGEWVYGWLGSIHSSNSQTKEIASVYFTDISEGFDCRLNVIVDYKTVGQYTGVTDMDGKKIFEGDIVCHNGKYGEIVFRPHYGEYVLVTDSDCFPMSYNDEFEIRGNIYDDHYLLEGGEGNG